MNELTLFEGLLLSGIIVFLIIAVLIIVSSVIDKIIRIISPKHKARYEKQVKEYYEKQKEFKSWKK